MKSTDLHKLIREAIREVISETTYAGKGSVAKIATDPKFNTLSTSAKQDISNKLNKGEDVDINEMARLPRGYVLADEKIDTSGFTRTISGASLKDVIEYIKANPGVEKKTLQKHFKWVRPQIANAVVNALVDNGILIKLGKSGEVETEPEESPEEKSSSIEDLFIGSKEYVPSHDKYKEEEPEEEEPEEEEPELPATKTISKPSISDEDYQAFMKYGELKNRLTSVKGSITQTKKLNRGGGDLAAKPGSELERLEKLRASLEKRIEDLLASSKYLQKREPGYEEPEEDEVEIPEPEELDEWTLGKLQYYAGIKK